MGLILKIVILIGVALIGSGCREHVIRDISEQNSIAITVALSEHGIKSDRVRESNDKWSVVVERVDLERSLALISVLELAKEHKEATSSSRGFLLGGAEVQDNLGRRMEHDLARSLSMLRGVISARVHINRFVQRGNSLLGSQEAKNTSASILLIVEPNSNMIEAQIRDFVSKSIGIPEDQISIILNTVIIPNSIIDHLDSRDPLVWWTKKENLIQALGAEVIKENFLLLFLSGVVVIYLLMTKFIRKR